MSEDDVSAALRAARTMARRWGCRDWREHVYGAWVGVRRYAAACPGGSASFLAGCRGVIDAVRSDRGKVGRGRNKLLHAAVRLDALARWQRDAVCPPAPDRPDADPLLALWVETAPARDEVHPRARLAAYLHLVEGWTYQEVGDAIGVGLTRVWQLVAAFRRGVAANLAPGACRG